MLRFCKTAIVILSTILPELTFSQPGFLDPSFGNSGKVTTYFSGINQANSILCQPDKKIIIVGSAILNNVFQLAILRYQENGTLDSSFGKDGISFTKFIEGDAYGNQVASLLNGKIICVGSISNLETGLKTIFIARYLSNGVLDSSFGKNGYEIGNFSDSMVASSVAIQSDQSILVAGSIQHSYYFTQFAVVHYFKNGKIDSSFGLNGRQLISFKGDHASEASTNLQNNGKIILVGSSNSGLHGSIALCRLNTNGSLDSSFGINGKQEVDFGGIGASGLCSALQADERIIVGGIIENFAVARFNQNGFLDSTFGTNGYTKTVFNVGYTSIAKSVLIQPNQQIIASGFDIEGLNNDFGIAKFNANGIIDSSFGINGQNSTDFGDYYDYCNSSCLQADNKIVLGGIADSTSGYRFALSRYNNDIVLAVTFLKFNASKKDNAVLLNWQTSNENNNKYFSIERSIGSNNNWKEIGIVNSKGNTSQVQSYYYEDIQPVSGINLYRLKQVDKDAKSNYSNIISVNFINNSTISLYPNPVKDILNVYGLDNTSLNHLSIININGIIVSAINVKDSNYKWNVHSLIKGVYYVQINVNGSNSILKFIKE